MNASGPLPHAGRPAPVDVKCFLEELYRDVGISEIWNSRLAPMRFHHPFSYFCTC
jgi:hypothetical protein